MGSTPMQIVGYGYHRTVRALRERWQRLRDAARGAEPRAFEVLEPRIMLCAGPVVEPFTDYVQRCAAYMVEFTGPDGSETAQSADIYLSGPSAVQQGDMMAVRLQGELGSGVQWRVQWGDGTVDLLSAEESLAFHQYEGDPGVYHVQAEICAPYSDEIVAIAAHDVEVVAEDLFENVAIMLGLRDGSIVVPPPQLVPSAPAEEGSPWEIALVQEGATVIEWEIDWGDGSPVESFDGSVLQASHVYPDGYEALTVHVEVLREITAAQQAEGLTPGYWKQTQHFDTWVPTGLSPSDRFLDVFGIELAPDDPLWTSLQDKTLLEALNPQSNKDLSGPQSALLRHATAGLLNALHPQISYAYSPEQVVSMVRDAFAYNSYEATKDLLAVQNELGADLADPGSIRQEVATATTVHVANVAPNLWISGPLQVALGQAYVISVSATDPGQDTIEEWEVDWGDGTPVETVPGGVSEIEHLYQQCGGYTVGVVARDEDGQHDAPSLHVDVTGLRLVEGTDFVKDAKLPFVVPDEPGALQLSIIGLTFDLSDPDSMNDAFEVALLDVYGRSLVGTIRSDRDAFFNITEGEEPLLGGGVVYDEAAGTVSVDISHLPPGSGAVLVARLVNDDSDATTEVTISPELVHLVSSPISDPTTDTEGDPTLGRSRVDTSTLADVTASMAVTYHRTSFNDATNILHADITLMNDGTYTVRGPLVVGVQNIAGGDVQVWRPDGILRDGTPYFVVPLGEYDADGAFSPGDAIPGVTLRFRNPDEVQFSYELVVLGQLNRAPEFVTEAEDLIPAGAQWSYEARAVDPDGDDTTYTLISGPDGMTLDEATGDMAWATRPDIVGNHPVVIEAADGHGGVATQQFVLNVELDLPNRPPAFTSLPVVDAYVGQEYSYQATAEDPDFDPLTFSAAAGPEGLVVAVDGLVTWTPGADDAGQLIDVQMMVQDGRGGTAVQSYEVMVHATPGNHDPIIVSEPDTAWYLPSVEASDDPNVWPGLLPLVLHAGASTTATVQYTVEYLVPELQPVSGTADFIFVLDESGSMQYGDHAWMANAVLQLDDALEAQGIVDNRYALVGFGDGYTGGHPVYGHSHMVGGELWGTAQELASAAYGLTANGGEEDGYQAIDFTLTHDGYEAREGAALNIILITDENRDTLIPQGEYLTYEIMWNSLVSAGAVLNVVATLRLKDHADDTALAVDVDGNAYMTGPDGAYTISEGGYCVEVGGDFDALQDYGELAWDTSGAIWDFKQLRYGDADAVASFTNSFVDIKLIETWLEFAEVALVAPGAPTGLVDVLTDPQSGDLGQALSFDVQFASDGEPHMFDLMFVRASDPGVLLGEVPVWIVSPYTYDTEAVDADGDTLTYELIGETHGATIDPVTGVVDWVPTADGQYELTVRVMDSRGGMDQQTWTLVIGEPPSDNIAPVITSTGPLDATEGRPYTYQVDAADPDGDPLGYYLAGDVPDGMSINPQTGLITWTGMPQDVGTGTIAVRVFDFAGGETSAELPYTLLAKDIYTHNNAPTFVSEPLYQVVAGQMYSYQARAVDVDDDPLVYELLVGPEGMAIRAETGLVVWEPADADVGAHTVVLRADDGQGGVRIQAFDLDVLPLNAAPAITSKPKVGAGVGLLYTYRVQATDPNGDVVAFSLDQASLDRGMLIDPASGLVSWVPVEAGDYRVVISASDERGASDSQEFTLAVRTNAPAEITSDPRFEIYVQEPYSYEIGAVDPDGGPVTLLLDRKSQDRGMFLDGNVIRWLPPTVGVYPVSVTAVDGLGAGVTQTYELNVLDPRPINSPALIVSRPQDSAIVNRPYVYAIRVYDPEGDPVSFSLDQDSLGRGMGLDGNILTWIPTELGAYRVTVTAVDAKGAGVAQSFTLRVVDPLPGQNAAARITSEPVFVAYRGEEYRYAIDAADPDGDAVTLSLQEGPAGMALQDGVLVWTPGALGVYAVSVKAVDHYGVGMIQSYDLHVVPLTENLPARIVSDPPDGVELGQTYEYVIETYEPDGDPVTLDLLSGPDGMGLAGNTLTWQPGALGTYAVSIRALDDHGEGQTQTFKVHVVEPMPGLNSPAEIASMPGVIAHTGVAYEYAVQASDPDGGPVTLSLDEAPDGMTLDPATGLLTWTPADAGVYAVSVRAVDEHGAGAVQSYDLRVLPAAANTPARIVSSPVVTALVNTPYEYAVQTEDADGDPVTLSLDRDSVDRGMALAGDVLTWTPSIAGEYAVRLTAADDGGSGQTQAFTVRVVDGLPSGNAPAAITSQPETWAFVAEEYQYAVVANDPDGGPVTLSLDAGSLARGMSLDGNTVTWTPSAAGVYRVSVTAVDGIGAGGVQSYDLHVFEAEPANTPPHITSTPSVLATLYGQYNYAVQTADDAAGVTWSYSGAPAGMTRYGNTLSWAPTPPTYIPGDVFTITITAVDADGAEATQTFDLLVYVTGLDTSGVSRPAKITSDPAAVAYVGQEYEYVISAVDPEGGPVTLSLDEAPAGMSLNGTTLSWTPSSVGTYGVSVSAVDSLGMGSTQSYDLEVLPANAPPSITSQPVLSALAGQPYAYVVTTHDADGDPVTLSLGEGPAGMGLQDGVLTWLPDAAGQYQVSVTAQDDAGDSATQVFTIEVVNPAPVANSPALVTSSPDIVVYRGETYRYQVEASDPDGDVVAFSLAESPAGMAIGPATGLVTWEPDTVGVYTVSVTAADGSGAGTTQTYSLHVLDPLPQNVPARITSLPNTVTNVGQPYQYAVQAMDPDGGAVTFSLAQGPSGMLVNGSTGILTWTPSIAGEFDVAVSAVDSSGAGVTQAFTLHVVAAPPAGNAPPTITSSPGLSVGTGQQYQYAVQASDPEGGAITFSLPAHPAGMSVNASTGLVTWQPGTAGFYQVSVRVTDSGGASVTQTYDLEVFALPASNSPARITSNPVLTVLMEQLYTYTVQTSDADGDPVTLALLQQPSGMSINTSTGLISWTPHWGQHSPGYYTVSVRALDNKGEGTTQTFKIHVRANAQQPAVVNAPATITSQPVRVVYVGQLYQYDVEATDPESNPITYSFSQSPGGMTINSSTGLISWTPQAAGVHTVAVRAMDNGGAGTTQTFKLYVVAVPVGNAPAWITSTPASVASAFHEYQYDIQATDADGDPITYALSAGPAGMSVDPVTGLLSWFPEVPGQYAVQVTALDDSGAGMSQSFTLAVTGPASDPNLPAAITSAPGVVAYVGQTYHYQVQANDPDGGTVAYGLVEPPAGMAIDPVTGLVTWEPGTVGVYTVSVTAVDGSGAGVTQAYGLHVLDPLPENSPPSITSSPDSIAYLGRPYEYAVVATDADGGSVALRLDAGPAGMSLDGNSLRWTPDAPGDYAVSITAEDATGDGVTQAFTIRVLDAVPADNAPAEIVSEPGILAHVGEEYLYTVLTADADSDPVALALVEGPEGMALMGDTLSWTPAEQGLHTVSVRATDQFGAGSTQTYNLYVLAPAANSPAQITSEPTYGVELGQIYQYAVQATDADGDPIVFSLSEGPAGMSVDEVTGLLTWEPSELGTYRVSVTALDSLGAGVTQTFELHVVEPMPSANSPAVITTGPGHVAYVGQEYQYAVGATDADGDTVEYGLLESPAGMEIDPATGLISWTPMEAGVYEVSVIAVDGMGAGAVQSFALHVLRSTDNSPAIIASEPVFGARVGKVYEYRIQTYDADGDPVTLALAEGPDGMLLQDGVLTWTPDVEGDFEVAITALDDWGAGMTQMFTLHVTVTPPASNAPPQITSDPPRPVLHPGDGYAYDVDAVDPDGDPITFALADGPAGMSVNANTGLVTWQAGAPGVYRVSVTASDGGGATVAQTYDLEVFALPENSPARITSDPVLTVVIGHAYTYDVQATDPEGDPIAYSLPQSPLGMSVDASTGVISWMPEYPGALPGYYTVSVKAVDDKGEGTTQTFKIHVRASPEQPAVVNAPTEITSEPVSVAYAGQPYQYDVQATDPEGDPITFSLSQAPGGMTINPSTGLISWTPQTGGVYTVAVKAMDTGDAGATQTFKVHVLEAIPNSPARITSAPPLVVEAGRLYQYAVAVEDADSGPVTLILDQGPDGMTVEDGALTWVPHTTGIYDVSLTALDDSGEGTTQSFSVHVIQARSDNAPARILSRPGTLALVDAQYEYVIETEDPDGDPVSLTLDDGSIARGMLLEDNVLRWQTPGTPGEFTVVITAVDNRGAGQVQTFVLVVDYADVVGRAPEISSVPPGPAVMDRLYRYQIIAHDADLDELTFGLADGPQGMSVDPVSGELTFMPTETGTSRVELTTTDGWYTTTQSYYLTVVQNAPPVITSQPTRYVDVGEPYSYQVTATDPNGDGLTYSLDGPPNGMSIDESTGLIGFTSATVGAFAVNVVVADTDGRCARQTYQLQVRDPAVNADPQILSQPRPDAQVGRLYEHEVIAMDPDGDRLTYVLVSGPAGMHMDDAGLVRWTPTSGQVNDPASPHSFTVRVEDGRGGFAEATCQVHVTHQAANSAPQILSAPVLNASVGLDYVYVAQGIDPEGDPVRWSLLGAPEGMTIGAETGVLQWRPDEAQIGEHAISLLVADNAGAATAQEFTVTVRGVNLAPVFSSTPPTRGRVNAAYVYAVTAQDPEGTALTFALMQAPADMDIDEATGLITWTPTAAATYDVSVRAADAQGNAATQSFRIVVLGAEQNIPPCITSVPSFYATLAEPYAYQVQAYDPNGQALTYSLRTAPAGMQVDSNTGLVEWMPGLDQVGHHRVEVLVSDGLAYVVQSFLVRAAGNGAPVVEAIPDAAVTAGKILCVDVEASDPDGNLLAYELDGAPAGMTIDGLGRILWQTSAADAGQDHIVTVTAIDPFGAEASQTLHVSVLADVVTPTVQVFASKDPAALGEAVTIHVVAVDNVAVASLALTVNGEAVALSTHGSAIVVFSQLGDADVVASAKDAAGNTGTASTQVRVYDPTDSQPPRISISSLDDGAALTSSAEVYGSVNDPNGDEVSWVLTLRSARTGEVRVLGTGDHEVAGWSLGVIDVSTLANGPYALTLEATDLAGNTARMTKSVTIDSDVKLGSFGLSFSDLSVSVGGLSVNIVRTYNSLDSARAGDFGYGWSLGYHTVELITPVEVNWTDPFAGVLPDDGFYEGMHVTVNTPDGATLGFTAHLEYANSLWALLGGSVTFVPDKGVDAALELVGFNEQITWDSYGRYRTSEGLPYNPGSDFCRADFVLTTADGMEFTIDARDGSKSTITGPLGNRIVTSAAGITSYDSSGNVLERVAFTRDQLGRITAVTDPAGKSIRYRYNAAGDLISVTDRTGRVVQFGYGAPEEHYLTGITDARGVTLLSVGYDPETGRLTGITDGAGNPASVDYTLNLSGGRKVETVTTADGVTTEQVYDALGNTVRTIKRFAGPDGPACSITIAEFRGDNRTAVAQPFEVSEAELLALGDTRYDYTPDDLVWASRATYDANGNITSSTDSLGNTTYYQYDKSGNLTSIVDPLGNVTRNAYDSAGQLVRRTDPSGAVTYLSYTADGQLRQMVQNQPDGTSLVLMNNEYDAKGRLLRSTDASGTVHQYAYDAAGNQTLHETTWTDPSDPGNVHTITNRTFYDAEGRVTGSRRLVDGAVVFDSTTEHDAAGLVSASVDNYGTRTEYLYDARGQQVETRWQTLDDTGALVWMVSRTVYDAAGRVVWQTDAHVEADPDSAPQPSWGTHYVYDGLGRVARTERREDVLITVDASGLVPAAVLSAEGTLASATEVGYDETGRTAWRLGPTGVRTEYHYSASGLLDYVTTDLDGNPATTGDRTTTAVTEYDSYGRTDMAITDRDGNLATAGDQVGAHYVYDQIGRLIRTEFADGTRTSTTYRCLGQVTLVRGDGFASFSFTDRS